MSSASSWLRNSAAVAAAVAACAASAAGQPDAVVVSALRNPVDKSYRKMMQGAALFEREHALAPQAALRFKLLPRKRDTDMEHIDVAVVGDSFELPVPVAPDNTFSLSRDAKALDENASVRPNRRAQSMTWRTEVRTPGLPAGTRRLGDLRLECRVGMRAGLVSHYPSVIGWALDLFGDSPELCDAADSPYLFFADRPLFAVTLEAAGRRRVLSVGELYAGVAVGETPKEDLPYCDCEVLLDRAFSLPLGDRSWPDDTLVRLEYMDGPGENMLEGFRREDVAALFGAGTVTRFDNGYEVWSYRYSPRERRLRSTEVVALVDPGGRVAKARLRPAVLP